MTAPRVTTFLPGIAEGLVGLEACFEFEDLVLHDRRLPDMYRLNAVDGLWDADVRDFREANPQAHGETAFTAWYGGRTLTFEGQIEAGNVNRLRNMAARLSRVTNDLTEKPLYMRTNGPGWADNFETDRLNEANLTGAALISGSRKLTGVVASESEMVRQTRGSKHLQQQTVVEFVTGPSAPGATGQITAIAKWIALADSLGGYTDWIGARIKNNALQVVTAINNTEVVQNTTAITLAANTRYWLRATIYDATDVEGSAGLWICYAEIATFDLTNLPIGGKAGQSIAYHTAIPTLDYFALGTSGASSTPYGRFGPSAQGYGGLKLMPWQTGDYVRSVLVLPLEDRDAMVYARKTSAVGMRESQNGRGLSRPFILPTRSSDPRWQGTIQKLRNLPATARTPIVNKGNFPATPLVRFSGPQNFPRLANMLAGATLALDATILTGDYYDVDIFTKTIKNKAGAVVASTLRTDNDWLTLLPGAQDLVWGRANASNGTEQCQVFWRDTRI